MRTEYLTHRNNTNEVRLEYYIHIIDLSNYNNGSIVFFPLNVNFSSELVVLEPLHLGNLVFNVLLAYFLDVLWQIALSNMFGAVGCIFLGWIQQNDLHKYHDQVTKFQWYMLHGLSVYGALVEWFTLVNFHESYVCYCRHHINRKSDFSKHGINMIVTSLVQNWFNQLSFTSILHPSIPSICLVWRYIAVLAQSKEFWT